MNEQVLLRKRTRKRTAEIKNKEKKQMVVDIEELVISVDKDEEEVDIVCIDNRHSLHLKKDNKEKQEIKYLEVVEHA